MDIKNRFKILLSFICLFLITACGNRDDEYIYHKAMGEGYVYFEDTKEPVPFAEISVVAWFPSSFLYQDSEKEDYVTDKNGYYKVKFIKRKTKMEIDRVSNGSVINTNKQFEDYAVDNIFLKKDFLKKQKKTFKIDTLWLKKID